MCFQEDRPFLLLSSGTEAAHWAALGEGAFLGPAAARTFARATSSSSEIFSPRWPDDEDGRMRRRASLNCKFSKGFGAANCQTNSTTSSSTSNLCMRHLRTAMSRQRITRTTLVSSVTLVVHMPGRVFATPNVRHERQLAACRQLSARWRCYAPVTRRCAFRPLANTPCLRRRSATARPHRTCTSAKLDALPTEREAPPRARRHRRPVIRLLLDLRRTNHATPVEWESAG